MNNISVFYDGYYLQVTLAYYRQTRRKVLDLSALHRFIGQRAEGVVTSAHAYYGRSAPEQMEERHLREDRAFDTLLAKAGVIPHVLPMNALGVEKGVDVWLALDLFEHVRSTACDVVALVSGDADYVPLLRKLKTLGTKSLVLGWNIPGASGMSQSLMREADEAVAMEAVLKNYYEAEKLLTSSAALAGNIGVVARLSEGYGFIAPRKGGPNLFFHYKDVKNRRFADLRVGDPVEFELGQNQQGQCARDVRVI